MTQRDPHSDNALIDELAEGGAPGQASSAGGNVARRVGSQADLERATNPEAREPATAKYNPEDNDRMGEKASDAIRRGEQGEGAPPTPSPRT